MTASTTVSLLKVNVADVAVGHPLPWPLFDVDGNLLADMGSIVRDQAQYDLFVKSGYVESKSIWSPLDDKNVRNPSSQSDSNQKQSQIGAVGANPAPEKEANIELDSVRWSVGEPLYLQTTDQPSFRYSVKLIGFVKNQSILVTAPLVDGKVFAIREGQNFIVRAFPGKKAYAFTCSAVKMVFAPHPYLHITYPKQVRSTTIRQGSRAPVKIIASVSVANPDITAAVTLHDLSMGGGGGVARRALGKKGDTGLIKFKVTAAGNDEFLVLNFLLRSITPVENGIDFRHGFEFFDVSPHNKLILSAFVHQTLAELE